jgi:hypothetical protein
VPEPIQEDDPAFLPAALSRWDEVALLDLDHHWGGQDGPYEITVTGGRWRAVYRGPDAARLESDSANDLRDLIRADYGARQTAAGDSTGRTGAAPDEYPTAPLPHCSDT